MNKRIVNLIVLFVVFALIGVGYYLFSQKSKKPNLSTEDLDRLRRQKERFYLELEAWEKNIERARCNEISGWEEWYDPERCGDSSRNAAYYEMQKQNRFIPDGHEIRWLGDRYELIENW